MLKFSEVRKVGDYYLNFIDEDSLETEFTILAEHAMVCISIGLSGCSLSMLCCQYKLLIVSCLVYFIQSVTVKWPSWIIESVDSICRDGVFFFFFRWACSNLRDSLTMVFAQNSSIFHWAVHLPIAFFKVWITRGDLNRSLKNYGFL